MTRRAGPLLLTAGLASMLAAAPAWSADVTARLRVDPEVPLGADPVGRLRLYAPDPVDPGSSISHWDTLANPDLLMEPFIAPGAPIGEIDLTLEQLHDIGWSPGNASVVVHFGDQPGEGFFAPGALGQQRRAAIEHVASIWAGLLQSTVPIHLDVTFDDLDCGDGSATLAQAGPTFIFESFSGADVGSAWYPGALAESLSGENLSLEDDVDPDAGDVHAMFNSGIDEGCLGAGSTFDYSLTGTTQSGRLSFVNVALHELAHGLGFVSLVNETTGANPLGLPDIWSFFTRDTENGLLWHQMTNSQRAASAKKTGRLVWDGPNVNAAGAAFLSASPLLQVDSPRSVHGGYEVSTAEFGPPLQEAGVGGLLVPAEDGSAAPREACQALVNAAAVNGQLALVSRGNCNFTVKVKNAQNAGAVGVVIVNNEAGPPMPMGGTDPSITIPVVMVRQDDGARLAQVIGGSQPTPTPTPPAPPPPPNATPTPKPSASPTPTPTAPPPSSEPTTLNPVAGSEPPSTCVPNPTTLCLENGRFRVRARWTTLEGATGTGNAVALTGDSGYFWFFESTNVEVVLKVKNACVAPFQHFWFFAAGLTDVDTSIEVADTKSGGVLTYHNPQGRAFPPVQDTDAFATCP
jgi:hypothetical protein